MKKYSSYRAAARESLRGNWTPAVLTVLVCVVVVEAVSGVAGLPAAPLFVAQNLTWGIIVSCALALAAAILFMQPFEYALGVTMLRYYHGDKSRAVANLFDEFIGHWRRYLLPSLLHALIVAVGTLLLVVPGIIFALSLSLTPFVAREQPELTAMGCLRRSRQLMKGRKWHLFVLMLTFLGWLLLGILTLGIGMLWVAPYIYQSLVDFYEEAKQEKS